MGENSVPDWFDRALATSVTSHVLDVAGTAITVRAWGDTAAPPILLVHGGAAHASWWDAIASLLAHAHRVLAIDLTGHGDSGRRSEYSIATWGEEVEAVLDSSLLAGRPMLVGHSMGGQIAAHVAVRRGADLGGLVLLDAEFTHEGVEPTRPPDVLDRAGTQRFYPDRETILAKFRLLPTDSEIHPWMTSYVAERSIVETAQGWSWKFDSRFFAHDFLFLEDLAPTSCPVVIAPADRGLVDEALAVEIADRLGGGSTVIIHESGHHALLAQPLQVAAVLGTLASQWLARAPVAPATTGARQR